MPAQHPDASPPEPSDPTPPVPPPANRAARRGGGSAVPPTRSPFAVPKPGRVPPPRQWSSRRT